MGMYEDIYAFENIYTAYQKARKGRRYKKDIVLFERHLESQLSKISFVLRKERYRHGSYREFIVNDSKKRTISATSFQDRIVHHAVYAYIEPLFEKQFIYDSYVCRKGKGSHRAVKRLRRHMYGVSGGYRKEAWYLKMDVAQYFKSIDHRILKELIWCTIHDSRTLKLLSIIINSRWDREYKGRKTGIPIGNLTSQLFANIYLNPLDHYIKEQLKCRYYVRYMDDIVICHSDRAFLQIVHKEIERYAENTLRLTFHPNKVIIKPIHKGVPFLGYILYPHYTRLRQSTVKRCKLRIKKYNKRNSSPKTMESSYMAWKGYASYANAWRKTEILWRHVYSSKSVTYSKTMKQIYLDYAATTPPSKRVVQSMKKALSIWGNPSSLHHYGQEAFNLLEKSRSAIATSLGVEENNVIFCSSATECSNLYLRSIAQEYKKEKGHIPHIVISDLEHAGVYETAYALEKEGKVTLSLVSSHNGRVRLEDVDRALTPHTALVAVIAVQNEIGTVQPYNEIAEMIQKKRGEGRFPLFYTDAVQAIGLGDLKNIAADAYSFSGHKIYGPKGVGVLVIKNTTTLHPLITGGGQERGVRSGTENILAIVGCAQALKEIEEKRKQASIQTQSLQTYLKEKIKKIKDIHILGDESALSPHILTVWSPAFPPHVAHALDSKGIAVSSGSACAQRGHKKSRILSSLGIGEEETTKTIRISIGRETKKADIDRLIKTLIILVQ